MGTLKFKKKKNTRICPRPHSFAMETGKESESVSHSALSDSVTPGTVACQAALSMGFPMQEYWSGLLFLSPGDLPNSGIKPMSLASPALAGGFFTTAPPGKPLPMFFILLRHESGENLPFISQWLSFHGKWSSNGLV